MKTKYIFLCLMTALFASCMQIDEHAKGDKTYINFTLAESNTNIKSGELEDIKEVNAYRFENNKLVEKYINIQKDGNGRYVIDKANLKGEMLFVANLNELNGLTVGKTTIDEVRERLYEVGNLVKNGVAMTGQASLRSSEIRVVLVASVAKMKIVLPTSNVRINKFKITGAANKAYLFEQRSSSENSNISFQDVNVDVNNITSAGTHQVTYLAEQNKPLRVEVETQTDKGRHKMQATINKVKRNSIYYIRIYGVGADATVDISTQNSEWESGSTESTQSVRTGIVDVANSELPPNVRVSATNDTLYIPHYRAEMKIAIKANRDAKVKVRGKINTVEVLENSTTRAIENIGYIKIQSNYRAPRGDKEQYMYLDAVDSEGNREGSTVLTFLPNPIVISGLMTLDNDATCDFDRYIEGEIGQISIPEGKRIRLAFDNGEDNWAKIFEAQTDSKAHRIVAGWKPNDPKADGRTQTARIIVEDADGENQETFIVKRKNWGLPVTKIGATWWCKYNLRGNLKDFSQQVNMGNEPTKEVDLMSFLNGLTDEQLLPLMGSQYQAGREEGMRLSVNENNLFYYEGFTNQTKNFGNIPATEMAPYGYLVPTFEDYRLLTNGKNMNLGYNTLSYANSAQGDERIEFEVTSKQKDLQVGGTQYGPIIMYNLKDKATNNNLVLFGLGHQWEPTPGKVGSRYIMLATSNSNGSWQIEGYTKEDGRGNWFKHNAQNPKKTRTIRCVKQPVEYMY